MWIQLELGQILKELSWKFPSFQKGDGSSPPLWLPHKLEWKILHNFNDCSTYSILDKLSGQAGFLGLGLEQTIGHSKLNVEVSLHNAPAKEKDL